MLLAHLSDPHLTTGPLQAAPAAGLHAALGRVMGLLERPDAIVITGDLTDHGHREEYHQLRELLQPLDVPVHLALGNHDDREAFLEVFAGTSHLAGGHRTSYAVDLPDASLVVLDSLLAGSGAGHLGPQQLAWLAEVIAARADRSVLLALHHPPAPVGIPFLDAIALDDAEDLAALLARTSSVVRVLCGHVHRVVTTTLAGAVVTCAGSTYRQSALDLTASGRMGYVAEPATVLVHELDDATGGACVTHTVPVASDAIHFPLPPR